MKYFSYKIGNKVKNLGKNIEKLTFSWLAKQFFGITGRYK